MENCQQKILQDSPALHFYTMNYKGDWKYLKQLFNLEKHPGREQARHWGPGRCNVAIYASMAFTD